MRSLIFLGLWAPRLCPSPPPAPQKVSVPESARRKPRTPLRLWPPQRTSTLPFHADSSKRSKSGSCPCSLALGRKLSIPWEPETSSDPSRRASRSHLRIPAADVEARSQPSPQGPRSLVAFGSYGRLF